MVTRVIPFIDTDLPVSPCPPTGLSLVVGLVLYISNINDEMLNRTKTHDAYFSYKYGWSFAFAAISFLLTEVTSPQLIWIMSHNGNDALNLSYPSKPSC